MKEIKFRNCSCSIIPGKFDSENIPLDCQATWDLISSGFTTGVFQLESRLGMDWCKKVQPQNIEELAALISLVRPGPLEGGQSQDYVDIKFGRKSPDIIHPKLSEILTDTHQTLCYQEQSIKIASEIAGFSLEEADNVRKGLGKKDVKLIASLKEKFIQGCIKKGLVNKETAEKIFSWIEKGQRYIFNKCISGDSIIRRPSKNNKFKCQLNISEMYNIRNNIEYAKKTGHLSLYKKWKLINSYGYGLSICKDNKIRPNIIKDITYEGIQKLYRIMLENNNYIDVTENHKFPTDCGDKRCDELSIGDELLICGGYEKIKYNYSLSKQKQICINKKYENIKPGFPNGEKNPGYIDGSFIKFKKFKQNTPKICSICKNANTRIEVHHINGNRSNNEFNNLINLCVSCHKKEEYKNGRNKIFDNGYPVLKSKIVSIEFIGEKEVFDIEMDSPNHNFVLHNDIITCNSHAVAYAHTSYISCYIKCHFPQEFFTSYLTYSNYKADPMDEIYRLVQDARLFGIPIYQPDIAKKNIHFEMAEDNGIRFGLSHIKGVGQSAIEKIISLSKEDLDTWPKFLKSVPSIHRNIGIALIKSGACDCYGLSRSTMIQELESILGSTIKDSDGKNKNIGGLTSKELDKFYEIFDKNKDVKLSLEEMVKKNIEAIPLSSMKKQDLINYSKSVITDRETDGMNKNQILDLLKDKVKNVKMFANKNRIESVKEIIKSLEEQKTDTNLGNSMAEKFFLGISLSCSPVDDIDDGNYSHNCLDIAKALNGAKFSTCAVIEDVKHTKTKKGKNPGAAMCFLTISDSTYSIDHAVVFPDYYEELSSLCKENNICVFKGYKKNGSIIIENIEKLI